jgi:hypothetical protein
MTRTKLIAHALLAGFAILNLGTMLKANAAPITVTRGSHGAAFIVDSDNIPVDAKSLPTSPNHTFPELTIRGSHGASIANTAAVMKSDMQAFGVPTLVNRGSHGASIIVH